MVKQLLKHKTQIILWFFILAYIIYFSGLTILRYRAIYSSYFDLGIMQQTVYNTYQAILKHDPSRILELTNPFGANQIKRFAIHNDVFLALIAPLYFIYSGPETLLIFQTVILGLGALAVFKICKKVFAGNKSADLIGLSFGLSYLMFVPMQRANLYEFHAVTLATTFLLFMFYFWLDEKPVLSFVFFVLSILTKEQVALTTAMFGLYCLKVVIDRRKKITKRSLLFPVTLILISIAWFLFSVSVITPYFRGSNHFAFGYYGDFGDSPIKIIIGIVKNPYSIVKYLLRVDSFQYLFLMLGPAGFLSLLSPIQLLTSLPEFAVNLLSNNWNMRNIIFHYTSVITPFVFISSIYGGRKIINYQLPIFKKNGQIFLLIVLLISTLGFSYFKGPLPFSREAEIYPLKFPQKEAKEVAFWAKTLKDDSLKISTTGQIAPVFTSRRFFYIFSANYKLADYVILRTKEIYDYPEKATLIPAYNNLKKNSRFELIYKNNDLEVYKKS